MTSAKHDTIESASQTLDALSFPLHGSRLIEASAGTGKTWTIAALYLRLVLGHGGEAGFVRALLPSEILVMTFTRAATRELSNRIRERLLQAAKCFRGEPVDKKDVFLWDLIAAYAPGEQRQQAAHRLMLAADTMDEAAVFTIDAWCQRMLREHAFDSGSLFDEELVSDESALLEDAVRDYWRQHVYRLDSKALASLRMCWADVNALEAAIRPLVQRVELLTGEPADSSAAPTQTERNLATLIQRIQNEQTAALGQLKQGWDQRAQGMHEWIVAEQTAAPKCFSGVKLKPANVSAWFNSLREWANDPQMLMPASFDKAWSRLSPAGITDACNKGYDLVAPSDFALLAELKTALDAIEPLKFALMRHAASAIAQRVAYLKQSTRQFGFADMLTRLRVALLGTNGPALRQRIVQQFPLAMIDEFQDTSPEQYQIFDALYQVASNQRDQGLFLIGDPKQSIYGFRGADIHSYLAARLATTGRHYLLGTNYRSTVPLVSAVNQIFLHAEGRPSQAKDSPAQAGFSAGAFKFRTSAGNPLPFEPVASNGRAETLVNSNGAVAPLSLCCSQEADLNKDDYLSLFAGHCAEHIVGLLNDEQAGFDKNGEFTRLQPADIAILVRDRHEAAAIRRALQRRKIASVYLSDKDSVIRSEEAADVLRWLRAVSSPLDSGLGRAAFATASARLSLAALATHAFDDMVWEQRVEQLKGLHQLWQRQGVLAMLRRLIHDLDLPASLLKEAGGERRLTNLLHLAELLQNASTQLDGEQALIRWLAEQIDNESEGGDERILRLESDAELVKVVTVHKSKGLEYPLVYLPFAVSARPASTRNRSFLEFVDENGDKQLDLSMSDHALDQMEQARIEEDLRLLYVALTRARHALWLGVASLKNKIHDSALGYLIAGGRAVAASELGEELGKLKGACDDILISAIPSIEEPIDVTLLSRQDQRPALIDAPLFSASFERDWSVGSFTSLTKAMQTGAMESKQASVVTRGPQQEKLLEDPDQLIAGALDKQDQSQVNNPDTVWHSFPRGPLPGQFLHEQLEWMGLEGFAGANHENFSSRLAVRCERAGWAHRQDDASVWLQAIANTTLPAIAASLCELQPTSTLPEMEFWFPSEHLATAELDRLCQRHLLSELTKLSGINGIGATARPALPERQLHGMLKGYADLVFEHEGRYWVLDYKSNWLGTDDASYHADALATAMAAHRYDVQGAIYLLALHRLLKSRLGEHYDPETQLGGALFFFLRGIRHETTQGCYQLSACGEFLDALDQLFTPETVNP
ncbi:exodeoxyribonuclease V subunit beta [Undibacterium piscinae]|uniref:RecBCD enzyme subunit RecB n=1 Tax=Undibacterium piscinae TaxID=2495591 RepID=A0A6M4A188_9BURK|nr:exodeoxyribonuclease V subunit beta [Undibacterium piscinae]